MASAINPSLDGLGESIRAMVQDSLENAIPGYKAPASRASKAAEQNSKHISDAIKAAFDEIQEKTMVGTADLREKIMKNARVVLAVYNNDRSGRYSEPTLITYDAHDQEGPGVAAAVVRTYKDTAQGMTEIETIIDSSVFDSSMDALLELYDKSKAEVGRAKDMASTGGGLDSSEDEELQY